MMCLMGMGHIHLITNIDILDNFMKDTFMDMVSTSIMMEVFMKVNGFMVRKKEKDFCLLLLVLTMANGLIT